MLAKRAMNIFRRLHTTAKRQESDTYWPNTMDSNYLDLISKRFKFLMEDQIYSTKPLTKNVLSLMERHSYTKIKFGSILRYRNAEIVLLNNELQEYESLYYTNILLCEIEKYDKYAWELKNFREPENLKQLEHIDYYAEKLRKHRWCHMLKYSKREEVQRILNEIPSDMDQKIFATNIAKAYRLVRNNLNSSLFLNHFRRLKYLYIFKHEDQLAFDCLSIITNEINFDNDYTSNLKNQ